MSIQDKPEHHPALWVPTLYFAEGLPYFVVATIAGLMYKSMGMANDQIALWTGMLGFVWVFKPLWSPFLEAARSKKSIVLLFQFFGGASLGLVALALHLPNYFAVSIALLGLVAIASATHDIAADGLYIASLSSTQQATYAGWQGGFYNVARFFSLGGLVVLAGYFEKRMAVAQAWSLIFGMLAISMLLLAIYHFWALPAGRNVARPAGGMGGVWLTLRDVIIDFFQKPGIWLAIAFIILFRAGEGQITTIGPLFLRAARAEGGLGLATAEVGAVYGTLATVAFICGSLLGGYFTAWRGLRRSMFFLILAMNLPNLAYFFLSTAMPSSLGVIAAALSLEMFGYGFGFVGLILFIMQEVAVGKYQMAHYALGTGIMQLGYVLFKMLSGTIQGALGYQHFFLWVLISAIPVLILSRIVPIGRHEQPADAAVQPAAV
ncbi:MFS transporter, PAT family, beta-lactamase induction signal transducer AmpG [Collimonas sp. OK307]|uniref:MFS transporter n=1 Tax=Collimonas sp. OK307 TaxID=1801620 RepID=UPI0008EC525A|nr:MFS transporter [Collimonas sp. OK307]SFI25334.1 MFS transporter, PAT family, beta-lactamase induction signal transducer AmpG [Collimonas sp. OK307]